MGTGGEVTGTIYSIGEVQQLTERFRKRTFCVTFADNPKYPQIVELQVTGDRCGDLDRWAEGEVVTASYNLRGREGKGGRVFNSLEVWKIEPAGDTSGDRRRTPEPETRRRDTRRDEAPPEPWAPPHGDEDAPPPRRAGPMDDLPFAACSLAAEPSPIAPVIRRAP